jgi:hypothetical protein
MRLYRVAAPVHVQTKRAARRYVADTSGNLNAFRGHDAGLMPSKAPAGRTPNPTVQRKTIMTRNLAKTLAVVALAVAAAGAQAASSVGARDPYTEGARAVQSAVDAYTEGARSSDVYTDGARSTDIYTDGARSANPYYDGAHA